jgi:RHS repeat-associated protein
VRFHDGNGDGDYSDAGDNIRYFTGDANYNVTAVLDAATGEVVERYVYTAYGAATVYSPTWTSPAAPTSDGALYCGYFLDADTALYQVRNRHYNAPLPTFISRDPIRADVNLYRYVGDNPLAGSDPSGMAGTVLGCVATGPFSKPKAAGGLHIGGSSSDVPHIPLVFVVCKREQPVTCLCERDVWRGCIPFYFHWAKEVTSVCGTMQIWGVINVSQGLHHQDGGEAQSWSAFDAPSGVVGFLTGGAPDLQFTPVLGDRVKGDQACNDPRVRWDKPRLHVPDC